MVYNKSLNLIFIYVENLKPLNLSIRVFVTRKIS